MSNLKGKSKKPLAMPRRDPLASLRMANMVILKPILPAEIMSTIVDCLAIPDLFRFARTSRRAHEMVYDDARWIQKLKRMGCWNDTEAKARPETPRVEEYGAFANRVRRRSTIDRSIVNGKGRPELLVNTGPSSPVGERKASVTSPIKRHMKNSDGFDAIPLSTIGTLSMVTEDPHSALTVLKHVQSIRGFARQEYAKVYGAIGKFYVNALNVHRFQDTLIFRTYSSPEQQAQMLVQIRTLSYSDQSPGSGDRERKLQELIGAFDTASLLEFRTGYEYKDVRGRMRQYAHVLHTLNGGVSSVELFLHDNNLLTQRGNLGSVSDCIDYSLGYEQLSLERVQGFFERLGTAYAQERAVIQAVFPNAGEVSLLFLETIGREVLSPFLSELFADAQGRGSSIYLRMISGTFAASKQFVNEYGLSANADEASVSRASRVIAQIYEPHLESYLAEELSMFQQKANSEIEQWDNALSAQSASTESFLMSNINRSADKKDFMSSFKKVVMMPVNILPSFSTSSTGKTATRPQVNGDGGLTPAVPSRSSTPNPPGQPRSVTPSLLMEAPTTELAAKAALMSSKLDNIRSLFSIEVALNLVHAAKSSLERAAQFIGLGGQIGESAKTQCSAIFVLLLNTVGIRHVKAGFDKAIDHLSNYNPREATSSSPGINASQVAPLATFLELVNVGDLIQQMLDVFYESELVRLRISNRDDFLDPSVKEKKKFEAMLDERVAAGLGKGIDVLMDEVEYLCATTQKPTDFNPESNFVVEIGPTETAKRVIDVVGGHTSMLTGTTDKTLLEVFSGEVGLRLFTTLCKHIKRQRISTAGALPLLSDLTAYAAYVASFRNNDLNSYFTALRELAQIYLIEGKSDKDVNEMATIISDSERYRGVFTVEEAVEFAERRSDWLLVKSRVEGRVRGENCLVM